MSGSHAVLQMEAEQGALVNDYMELDERSMREPWR
jgi:hypothetical protein